MGILDEEPTLGLPLNRILGHQATRVIPAVDMNLLPAPDSVITQFANGYKRV